MVILYFVRWFNIILFLRFLFQTGRLCTKLGFFVYYYLPYCYLHQTQENENVRTIKEGKIILKIALRLWSYVLDFLFSNPIVWSYIFRRIDITRLAIKDGCGLWMAAGWPIFFFFFFSTFFFQPSSMEIALLGWKYHYMDDFRRI